MGSSVTVLPAEDSVVWEVESSTVSVEEVVLSVPSVFSVSSVSSVVLESSEFSMSLSGSGVVWEVGVVWAGVLVAGLLKKTK